MGSTLADRLNADIAVAEETHRINSDFEDFRHEWDAFIDARNGLRKYSFQYSFHFVKVDAEGNETHHFIHNVNRAQLPEYAARKKKGEIKDVQFHCRAIKGEG